MKSNTLLASATLAVVMSSAPAPVQAGDLQGDAYTCKEMWVLRNQIYKDRGYCFKTAKAIAHFSNAGCRYDDIADVPLSDMDRVVIRDVKVSSKRQRC